MAKEKPSIMDRVKGAVKDFQAYQAGGRKQYHHTEEEIRNSPANQKFIRDQQTANEHSSRHKEYR